MAHVEITYLLRYVFWLLYHFATFCLTFGCQTKQKPKREIVPEGSHSKEKYHPPTHTGPYVLQS